MGNEEQEALRSRLAELDYKIQSGADLMDEGENNNISRFRKDGKPQLNMDMDYLLPYS